MKLKKIASLMLAGIMAVSMLAACGEASSNSTETPDVTPVTGVAATVNGELDKNAKKISFTDDKVVTDLLTNYFKENPVQAGNWTSATDAEAKHTGWYHDLQDTIKAVIGAKNENHQGMGDFSADGKNVGTYFSMYVLNSDVLTQEDALRMVGQNIDSLDLPTEGAVYDAGSTQTAKNKDFSYTGTVAAIEAESKGGTESVWVIVATITQTSADK